MKIVEKISRFSFIKYLALMGVTLCLCLANVTSSYGQDLSNKGDFSGVIKSKTGTMLEFEGGFAVDTSGADIASQAGAFNLSLIEVLTNTPATARIEVDPRSTPERVVLKADHVSVGLLPNEVVFIAPIQRIDGKTITVFSKDISIENETLVLRRKKKKAKPSTFATVNLGDTVLVDALFVNGQLVARKIIKVETPVYGNGFFVIGNVESVSLPSVNLVGGVEVELSNFMFNANIEKDDLMYFGFIPNADATTPPLNKIFAVALSKNFREPYLAGKVDKIDLSKNTITMFNREIRVTSETNFDGDNKDLKSLNPAQPLFVSFMITASGELVAKTVNQNNLDEK